MLRTLIQLFIQFFQIGIFSFGGGYATLPFLYNIGEKYHWYTSQQLTQMLAVSSITPGPVGVNVATYAGFTTSGIIGALVATTAIALPALIIVTITSKLISKYKENRYVLAGMKGLKASGCALLLTVWIRLLFTSSLYLIGSIICVLLIASSFIKKKEPLFYLALTAVIGLILGNYNLIGI